MPSERGCGLEIFNHSGFRPSLPAPVQRRITRSNNTRRIAMMER